MIIKKKSIQYLLAVASLVFTSCIAKSQAKEVITEEKILIGYCPTMAEVVLELQKKAPMIEIRQFPSAAAAFQALHNNSVDAIIVGRKAHSDERTSDLDFVQLEDGFTLITQFQTVLLFEDVRNYTVHTAAEEGTARSLLQDETKILFYTDFEGALQLGIADAVLLKWSQVDELHNLLIPIDALGNKIKDFRSPFIYYLNSNGQQLFPVFCLYP